MGRAIIFQPFQALSSDPKKTGVLAKFFLQPILRTARVFQKERDAG